MQSLLLNFTELLHASTTFDRSSEFYTNEAPILSIMLHFTTVRRHFDHLVRLETPTISMLRSARERRGHAAPCMVCDSRAAPNIWDGIPQSTYNPMWPWHSTASRRSRSTDVASTVGRTVWLKTTSRLGETGRQAAKRALEVLQHKWDLGVENRGW